MWAVFPSIKKEKYKVAPSGKGVDKFRTLKDLFFNNKIPNNEKGNYFDHNGCKTKTNNNN